MSPSDSLFSLIKSLTKSELRYFRLFASGEKNNSIQLFDAMQKIKGIYDENIFKEKYKSSGFVKNLAYSKYYLYNLILKSLINFDYEKTVKLKIFSLLQKSEILIRKKLPHDSLKIVLAAKKLAVNYDLYSLMVLILEREKQIYTLWTLSDNTHKKFEEINKEKNMYLKMILNLEEYVSLNESVYIFLQKSHHLPKAELKKKISNFVKHPLLINYDKAISYKAKITLYDTLILLYSVESDFENSYMYQKKFLELMETKKFETKNSLLNYLRGYNNFMYLCLVTERNSEFLEAHKKTGKIFAENYSPEKEDKKLGYTYLQNCNLNLLYYIHMQDFEEGLKYISGIEKFLETEARRVNEDIYVNVLVNASGILFSCFEYEKSLEWINKLLLDKSIPLRNDLYLSANFMNFIIHYEMQDYELLPVLYKNLSKKMSEIKIGDKLELEILAFLKNLSNLPAKIGLKNLVKDFYSFLNFKKNHDAKFKFEKDYYFLDVWMGKVG